MNTARQERGTRLASGFIAGGALMGVVSAGLRFGGFEYVCDSPEWLLQSIGLGVHLGLIIYLAWDSMRAKLN